MSLLFFDDRTPFAAGRAEFVDLPASQQGGTAKIYVRIEPESFGSPIDAELDTGATWSVLNAEVAEALDLPLATLDRRLSRASGPSCRFWLPQRA